MSFGSDGERETAGWVWAHPAVRRSREGQPAGTAIFDTCVFACESRLLDSGA
jgi:hypothetical protein